MKPDINTCFVISPISDEGSPIRAEADKLLWIIKTVSEKHSFTAIRVDEVAGTNVITDEIKNFITRSGMCICVLTESNPNVFYETGLRHSTNKPYIHLMRKGNNIPFDLKGISTIFYGELDSFEEVRSLSEKLDTFFSAEKSKVSAVEEKDKLDTVLEVLKGMSVKIDSIKNWSPQQRPDIGGLSYSGNTEEEFLLAIAQADVGAANSMFPNLLNRLFSARHKLASAQRLAEIGGPRGMEYILDNYSSDPDISDQDILSLVSSVIGGFRDQHNLHRFDDVVTILDVLLERAKGNESAEVIILNQKQKLFYTAERYEEAMPIAEEILRRTQDEPAFFLNASLIYEKLGLQKKALECVEKMLAFEADDPNHLSQAIDIYMANQNNSKVKELFERLQRVDPRIASIKALDADLRKALGLTKR